jgi:hypothetical protein
MWKRTKAVGLVLAAAAVLGATMASAAQAGEFKAEAFAATFKGTQTENHQFRFNAGTVNCAVAQFDGKLAAASNRLTIGAAYSECSTPGGAVVNVRMTSCDYTFIAGVTLINETVDGSMEIQCNEAGDEIEFEEPANGCVVKIPTQAGLTTLKYTDHKAMKDFDVDFAVTEMLYTQNASCPGEAGVHFNGEYSGQSTFKGEHEGVGTGVTVD